MTRLTKKAALLAGTVICAAAAITPAMAETPMEATGVKYERKDQINNGEPIEITYWEWTGQRAEYQRKWADAYMEMYPNVKISIALQPWETYWPALTTNVPAGKGPSLWHMHTAKWSEFCEGNLMAPIPATAADPAYLNEHWIGFKEGALSCPETGSIHTVPMGAMLPMLFINKDMWDEAGLTEADYPKTWEEMREVAKTLTVKDRRDRITRAGVSFISFEWIQNTVYQQGRYMFGADGKSVQMENPQYKAALQYVSDLVHVDGTLDQEIMNEKDSGFLAGKSAMFIGFSWLAGFIDNNSDMNWVAINLPTPDGMPEPAIGNMRFAVEAVVNPYAPEAEQAVAWDFWHFNYANEQVILDDLALRNGFLPPYDGVQDDPKLMADPVISLMSDVSQYGVMNDVPRVVLDEIDNLVTSVILDDSDLDGKIAKSAEVQNTVLGRRDDWNIIERNYIHNDLMIADQ